MQLWKTSKKTINKYFARRGEFDLLKGEVQRLTAEMHSFQTQNEATHQAMIDRLVNMEDHYLKLNALVQEIGHRVLDLENALPTRTEDLRNRQEKMGAEIVSSLLLSRLMFFQPRFADTTDGLDPQRPSNSADAFEIYLEKFKNLYPHLYDVWANINFGVNPEEFRHNPERSCAVEARPNARLFRGFVAPYLNGRVLDVGCGPQPTPNYLLNYPANLISGIDPIEPFEPHPFEFVRGFAEFLPWPDAGFDVVIAATSLDHTLSLDLAYAEMKRVLKPGGFLLVWDWFDPVSRPYRPEEQKPELIDNFHLFHLSEDWFEEMVGVDFSIVEKLRLYDFYQYDRFYALKRKG